LLDPIVGPVDAERIVSRARLFDTPRQAVIATTASGTIIYWSRTAERLYGWAAAEAIGRDVLDVTPTAMSRDTAAALMNHLRTGRSWTGRFTVQRRDGSEFSAYVQDLPVLDDQGTLVGIVGVSSPSPLADL
jgi:PAS domain S-box-containing protein